jgi:hypothetical protein
MRLVDLQDRISRDQLKSMINLRPSRDNRSRGVEDPAIRERIVEIVNRLVLS